MKSLASINTLPNAQRGATLIVTMIFLLIITVIAISSLSNLNLQTKLLSDFKIKQMTFQAAESAINERPETSASSYFTLAQRIQSIACEPNSDISNKEYHDQEIKLGEATASTTSKIIYKGIRRNFEKTGGSIRICEGQNCSSNLSTTYVVEVVGQAALENTDIKSTIHQGFTFHAANTLCNE